MTVKKLKKLEDIIKPILKEQPQTRDDDFVLYAEIIKSYDPKLLQISARTVFIRHEELKIPNIKSVERIRRKIQEKCPELASERTKRKRAEEKEVYITYSKT